MLTGELKNKIDTVWNAFWSGGIDRSSLSLAGSLLMSSGSLEPPRTATARDRL